MAWPVVQTAAMTGCHDRRNVDRQQCLVGVLHSGQLPAYRRVWPLAADHGVGATDSDLVTLRLSVIGGVGHRDETSCLLDLTGIPCFEYFFKAFPIIGSG